MLTKRDKEAHSIAAFTRLKAEAYISRYLCDEPETSVILLDEVLSAVLSGSLIAFGQKGILEGKLCCKTHDIVVELAKKMNEHGIGSLPVLKVEDQISATAMLACSSVKLGLPDMLRALGDPKDAEGRSEAIKTHVAAHFLGILTGLKGVGLDIADTEITAELHEMLDDCVERLIEPEGEQSDT